MHFFGCWHVLWTTPPDLAVFPKGRTTNLALHMEGGMQHLPPPQGPYLGVFLAGNGAIITNKKGDTNQGGGKNQRDKNQEGDKSKKE